MNSKTIGLRFPNVGKLERREIETFIAASFFQRLRGLLGRKSLGEFQGLLLEECNSVHTIGMRFAIDIIFLSADFRIVEIHSAVAGFSFRRCKAATHTLELAAGQGQLLRWTVGDALKLHQKSTDEKIHCEKEFAI
ncbi:MAG: hypothetical protein CME36_18090 [unclassified Hahellaceae]|nr:hypothetical protein [Hahellaceae bacterium]|tara:strand:- start:83468 stop:83875 length:408 start_codon:yes stop_codon:yes gene_type:complete